MKRCVSLPALHTIARAWRKPVSSRMTSVRPPSQLLLQNRPPSLVAPGPLSFVMLDVECKHAANHSLYKHTGASPPLRHHRSTSAST
jgi:hypothetical protein